MVRSPVVVKGRISVILPAYQLGDVLGTNLDHVWQATRSLGDVEIVVVDDGSTDGTLAAAAAAAERHGGIVVVTHSENRGKGEALVTGWRVSTGERIVFLDADLDLPPEQLGRFLDRLTGADVVVGAKRQSMGGGSYPPLRRLLSRVFALATAGALRLPVEETQTGIKAFRRPVLDTVLPAVRLRGYAFDLELVARAHDAGFHIVEEPAELGPTASTASLRARMVWELGRDTVRLVTWRLAPGLFDRAGATQPTPRNLRARAR